MEQKRLRIFAGPNGSGKTTIIQDLRDKIPFGAYVNADDIEATLRINRELDISAYGLKINTDAIQEYLRHSTFSPIKTKNPNLWTSFIIDNNRLKILEGISVNAYMAADIAEFLRQQLLMAGKSFTCETVMSHEGKLNLMEDAKQAGYRVYLYYIATDDPEININRVSIRVALDGHNVSPEIISKRYYKSLANLKNAIQLSDRAYLFDNSGSVSKLLAEVTDGLEVSLVVENELLPNWFIKYVAE